MFEKKTGGRKRVRPSAEVLDAYYKDHDAKETAKHFGVSPGTVYRWVSEFRKEMKENAESGEG